jgi:hypothetical protein
MYYTAGLFHYLLTHDTLTFFLLGLDCSLVALFTNKEKIDKAWLAETVLRYDFACVLGLGSLYQAALRLGLVTGATPESLQWQVGWAYLGTGIAGLLAFRSDFGLRVGVLLMYAGLSIGPRAYSLYVLPSLDWATVAAALWPCLLPLKLHALLLQFSWFTNKPKAVDIHTSFPRLE